MHSRFKTWKSQYCKHAKIYSNWYIDSKPSCNLAAWGPAACHHVVRRQVFINRVCNVRGSVHAGLRTVSPPGSSCWSCCSLPTGCFSLPFSREVQPLCLIRVLPDGSFLCSPATWPDRPVTIPIKTQQLS